MTSYQRRVQNKLSQPLTRRIDLEGLVLAGIAKIDQDMVFQLIRDNDPDNHIDLLAMLAFTYPDEELCSTASDHEHYEDIEIYREHFLTSWYTMAKFFSLHFSTMLHHAVYAALASWSTTSSEDLDGNTTVTLQVRMPCYDSYVPEACHGYSNNDI